MLRCQLVLRTQNSHKIFAATISNIQVITGTRKHPDAGLKGKYVVGNYSSAYEEIVSCFNHLTQDNPFQQFSTQEKY